MKWFRSAKDIIAEQDQAREVLETTLQQHKRHSDTARLRVVEEIMKSKSKRDVAIYDDDEYGRVLERVFKDHGLGEVIVTDNPIHFADFVGAQNGTLAAIIVDIDMPHMSGLDILKTYQRKDCLKVVVTSNPEGSSGFETAKYYSDLVYSKTNVTLSDIVTEVEKYIQSGGNEK